MQTYEYPTDFQDRMKLSKRIISRNLTSVKLEVFLEEISGISECGETYFPDWYVCSKVYRSSTENKDFFYFCIQPEKTSKQVVRWINSDTIFVFDKFWRICFGKLHDNKQKLLNFKYNNHPKKSIWKRGF